MSMVIKSEGNSEIKQLEPGVYTGIASAIIDLGIQENTMFGKKQRKVMIVWNIVGETVTVNDEEMPRVMSKEYTMSLGEKSTLRKDLEAWRGRPFSTDELNGFDLTNILNVPCQLQINQQEKNGKTFVTIAAIMAIPKGMKVEEIDNAYFFDTYDSNTWENYDKIPNWIKEKFKKALNIKETELDMFIADYEEQQKENEGKEQENKKAQKVTKKVTQKVQQENDDEIIIPDDDLPF